MQIDALAWMEGNNEVENRSNVMKYLDEIHSTFTEVGRGEDLVIFLPSKTSRPASQTSSEQLGVSE